jgi:hypothetical protein
MQPCLHGECSSTRFNAKKVQPVNALFFDVNKGLYDHKCTEDANDRSTMLEQKPGKDTAPVII